MAKLIKHKDVTDIGATNSLLNVFLRSPSYQWYDKAAKGKHHVDVENIKFPDNSKECVVCFEVLEHTEDPVKAMKELKRVFSKQLIITVPYEPYFTFFRLGWDKEHYWAIRPSILKHYLGKPVYENLLVFRRYYVAVWEK